jgi:oleate hydratase
MTSAPPQADERDSGGWALWEKLAEGRPSSAIPRHVQRCIPSRAGSRSPSPEDPGLLRPDERFSGNRAGTGGLVTFKDSNWLMSIVLAHQPHFRQPAAGRAGVLGLCAVPRPDRQFRGQADGRLHRRGDPAELCGHLRFDPETWSRRRQLHPLPNALHHQHVHARAPGDRPLPVPPIRRISRSSASSSKFRTTSCSPWSIRCARRRWPSTSCSASSGRSRR